LAWWDGINRAKINTEKRETALADRLKFEETSTIRPIGYVAAK
jgi:hypothetical protein